MGSCALPPRGCVTTRSPASRPPTYRGCSAARRRRGVIRTTPVADVVAIRRGRRLMGADLPPASVFVNLELEDDAYAGVPCWSGGPARWAHVTVPAAYDLHYCDIRPQMTSGGIAKQTLIVIAAAMARHADRDTGRNARPTNDQLASATGFTERTIQRARECLRLLGVATEVLRGRQRTYIERMASWRMGDRHRGWASVWTLHDNAQLNRVIHSVSPHLERSPVTTTTSPGERLVTTRGRHKGARHGATRRPAPDQAGRRLAAAWRADPHAPPWARRFTPTSWAAMLAAPAAAGWTPRDLNQLITDWLSMGRRIPDNPTRPIGLLGAILAWHGPDNLADRPAALDEAREAQAHAAAEQARRAAREESHRAHLAGRAVGKAAMSGPGRAQVAQQLALIRVRAAARRTEQAAVQTTQFEAYVAERRHNPDRDSRRDSR